jgi:P4 family phage/plasmid primase-like protien
MVGIGANGKSVVIATLFAMLGSQNISTVPLEDFGKRFQLAQTLGKLANICAEIGELDKTAEGTLKAFTSGDPMTLENKGKDPFTARPTARLVMCTNNVPRFVDKSEGVWRRMLLLPFNRRVPEADRVPGMDKEEFWANEAAGILNWSLQGLRRLRENKMQFTQSLICRAALEEHRRLSDPCRDFLLEHYVADPNAEPLRTTDVYREYLTWCEENGNKYPLSAQAFGRHVRHLFKLDESRTHRFAHGVHRAWFGLAHRSELPADVPAAKPAEPFITDEESIPF